MAYTFLIIGSVHSCVRIVTPLKDALFELGSTNLVCYSWEMILTWSFLLSSFKRTLCKNLFTEKHSGKLHGDEFSLVFLNEKESSVAKMQLELSQHYFLDQYC